MSASSVRWRTVGGIGGPLAFVAAWGFLGHSRNGYSPIDDPISQLAAIDASSRWAMTAGFLAFGTGVSLYATEVRAVLPGGAGVAALTSGVATIGIAVTPLGSSLGGAAHATCAGVAYAALAATPVLGGRSLASQGHLAASRASTVAGIASGVALLASAFSSPRSGLFQRVGLTVGDAWIVVSACQMLRRRGARGLSTPAR